MAASSRPFSSPPPVIAIRKAFARPRVLSFSLPVARYEGHIVPAPALRHTAAPLHCSTAPANRAALAARREPSRITPGPEGSWPLRFDHLVQPVLDRQCVSCHNPAKPDGGVVLTGQPQGRYTVSYNALAPRVPYSAWGGKPGDFRVVNSEPVSQPGFFGARNSSLMTLLRQGHEKVVLPPAGVAQYTVATTVLAFLAVGALSGSLAESLRRTGARLERAWSITWSRISRGVTRSQSWMPRMPCARISSNAP